MKEFIEKIIKDYVKNYPKMMNVNNNWEEPVVSFVEADDEIYKLKEIVSPTHALPSDFLENAKTVVVYFILFQKEVYESNKDGIMSSGLWAKTYIETNRLILDLNTYIREKLREMKYESNIIPATHNYRKKEYERKLFV